MSAVAAINLSELDRSTPEAIVEAREIAAALLGWRLQTDTELRNGQPVEVVRRQNAYPNLPIYFKPGSRTHHDTQYGYVYEFDIVDVVDAAGRNCWDLNVYFAGEPTAPTTPVQVYGRRFLKADYRIGVLKEVILPREIKAHSERRVFEWARTPEGQAHIAIWQQGPGPAAAATNRLYTCQRDLARVEADLGRFRRAYLQAKGAEDNEELDRVARQGLTCRQVRDELTAEIAKLTALVAPAQQ